MSFRSLDRNYSPFLTQNVIASEGSLAVIAIPPLAGEAISKQLGINSAIPIKSGLLRRSN